MTRTSLTGWGRTAATYADVVAPSSEAEVATLVTRGTGPLIARGLGRSYGDCAQTAGGTVVDMTGVRGITGWERGDGVVTCGAGVSLRDLINESVPRGWFVPVTPGTSMVTVGGAIAADVHGKNHHHAGNFSAHVRNLSVIDAAGSLHHLEPGTPGFRATVGGMGLTGVITSAEIALIAIPGSQMHVNTQRTANFDETVDVLTAAESAPYCVAWLDCVATGAGFGRGVVTSGEHAPGRSGARTLRDERVNAPSWVPPGLLNRHTIALFNSAWHRRAPRQRYGEVQPIREFFYPLDAVGGWNRIYGRGGFVQYQCVVPASQLAIVQQILETFTRSGIASFLTVLKRFGASEGGLMSFPMPGWTLALDIPTDTPGLATQLRWADEQVVVAGGRVYLAKDSRMAPDMVVAMYPALPEFREACARFDPHQLFASDLSRRLQLLRD